MATLVAVHRKGTVRWSAAHGRPPRWWDVPVSCLLLFLGSAAAIAHAWQIASVLASDWSS